MLLQKRIRKPPQNNTIQYPTKVKRPKISAAKKKLQRCTYQAIPPSSKFPANSKIFSLYGDIIALEVQDDLHFDFSLWNQCLSLQQIKVMDSPNQKLVVLDLIQRENDKILPWEKAVKKLKNKKDSHLLEWSQLIQDFSAKYEHHLNKNEALSFSEESEFELEEEQKNLLANNSCIMVRSNLEEGKPRVSELLFTEKFIKEVEHSVDSFVSLILQDGIPQFTPKNDTIHTLIQKTVLQNYFTLENSSYKVPQQHFSQLLTKDSHIKDVKTQVYLFPKKFNGKPAINVIYVILEASISDQQLFVKGRRTTENKIYKEKLQRREMETSHFLMSYYQDFMPKPIVNLDKVCGIRELPRPPDDDDEEETDDCYIESLKSESL